MKRTILSFIVLFFALTGVQAQKSRVVVDSIQSAVLGEQKMFSVYLPAGYDTSGEDYPVLYLLHGAWGDHTDWSTKGNARRIADAVYNSGMGVPAVIVMPDASGEGPDKAGYRMGYFDREGWNYETHFFEEFIPFVESKYRIRSEKKQRAVSGLSMGGGGSMVYALHHPEMFGSCAPLSGLLGSRRSPRLSVTDEDFLKNVEQNDPQHIIKEVDEQRLDEFRSVRWYIDCGDDDYLSEFNVEMYLLMLEKNIPLEYRMRDGAHNWEYWQGSLPVVLQFISTGFAR